MLRPCRPLPDIPPLAGPCHARPDRGWWHRRACGALSERREAASLQAVRVRPQRAVQGPPAGAGPSAVIIQTDKPDSAHRAPAGCSANAAHTSAAFAAKPPRGCAVFERNPRLGKYIETEGEPDTAYRTFENIAAKARPK